LKTGFRFPFQETSADGVNFVSIDIYLDYTGRTCFSTTFPPSKPANPGCRQIKKLLISTVRYKGIETQVDFNLVDGDDIGLGLGISLPSEVGFFDAVAGNPMGVSLTFWAKCLVQHCGIQILDNLTQPTLSVVVQNTGRHEKGRNREWKSHQYA
jgi:hypothetical protein